MPEVRSPSPLIRLNSMDLQDPYGIVTGKAGSHVAHALTERGKRYMQAIMHSMREHGSLQCLM